MFPDKQGENLFNLDLLLIVCLRVSGVCLDLVFLLLFLF